MSIRHRLTLFYTSLFALTLVLFSTLLFLTFRYILFQQVERELLLRESNLRGALLIALSEQESPSLLQIKRLPIDQEALLVAPGTFVQVIDRSGAVIFQAPSPAPPALAALARVTPSERGVQSRLLAGARLYLLTSPLVLDGEVAGVIQVGLSLVRIDRALQRLALLLLLGNILTILLVSWCGQRLAGRVLAPIAAMSEQARAVVRHQDLDARLPVSHPTDELGQLALTFNDTLDQISHLFALQRRFVADAAHELRTPLTSIRGYTALLRRGAVDDPEAREEALSVIDSEAARLTRLVNDLLLLAQSDSALLEITREPVPLSAVVADVLRQERLLAPEHEWRFEHLADPLVLGDPDRLYQLVINLLDNARRHTPPGTQIRVILFEEAGSALLAVSDNGPGIPEESLPHLFDPFFRSDPARHTQGAGLGLAIAARITAAHSGTISVLNNPAGGARFTVRLPLITLDPE